MYLSTLRGGKMDKNEVKKELSNIKENVEFIERKVKRGDIGFVCDDIINKIERLEEGLES